ncbi:GNAT family N-acetyltransferase, partial [Saccharomonospora iraqiensis]|uniref:GNAT family N-acetyltransferase n=1 Tax=Saccharomonospora iraqiensis TaxID=52698 RepID=UPI00022DF197
MEPVEINAGTFYLRQLRADTALDDRPALLAAAGEGAGPHLPGTADEATAYIARRGRQWADDEVCTWAVAEPTTGALLGEVALTLDGTGPSGEPDVGELAVWVRPDARGRG